MSFALIQKTLDQKIERQELEAASVVAPSVARGDCARLVRSLFGILVQNIPEEDARALQQELARRNFPTNAVPMADLPLLPEPHRKRGIRFDGQTVTAIDGIGREQTVALHAARFVAGGFLATERSRRVHTTEWDYQPVGPYGLTGRVLTRITEDRPEHNRDFRLELFLSESPFRWQFPLDKEGILRANGSVLRLRNQDELTALLSRIAALFPPGCRNLGTEAAMRGEIFNYPSAGAFEEELVWHLYQALHSSQ